MQLQRSNVTRLQPLSLDKTDKTPGSSKLFGDSDSDDVRNSDCEFQVVPPSSFPLGGVMSSPSLEVVAEYVLPTEGANSDSAPSTAVGEATAAKTRIIVVKRASENVSNKTMVQSSSSKDSPDKTMVQSSSNNSPDKTMVQSSQENTSNRVMIQTYSQKLPRETMTQSGVENIANKTVEHICTENIANKNMVQTETENLRSRNPFDYSSASEDEELVQVDGPPPDLYIPNKTMVQSLATRADKGHGQMTEPESPIVCSTNIGFTAWDKYQEKLFSSNVFRKEKNTDGFVEDGGRMKGIDDTKARVSDDSRSNGGSSEAILDLTDYLLQTLPQQHCGTLDNLSADLVSLPGQQQQHDPNRKAIETGDVKASKEQRRNDIDAALVAMETSESRGSVFSDDSLGKPG